MKEKTTRASMSLKSVNSLCKDKHFYPYKQNIKQNLNIFCILAWEDLKNLKPKIRRSKTLFLIDLSK